VAEYRGRGADREGLGLADVDGLPSSAREGGEGGGEGREAGRGEVSEKDGGVIRELRGGVSEAYHLETQGGDGAEPGGEGLCNSQVEDGREGAPLTNTSLSGERGRLAAVGASGSSRVAEEEADPSEHAWRGPKRGEGIAEEVTVNRVERLADVQVDEGPRSARAEEDVREEVESTGGVGDQTVGQEGVLFWANGRSEGRSEAVGEDLGQDAVERV
jgi:hypothetical protein